MRERTATVVPFPAHRRSTLHETLEGYAGPTGATIPGQHRRRRITLVFAELRGWERVSARLGHTAAVGLLEAATAAALECLRSADGRSVTVGGTDAQPVVSASFDGPDHAARALRAAAAARDAVAAAGDPGFGLCVGVNSGDVVHTEVGGERPVAFQALGTVRMFATRLQEFAGPGQIFLSAATLEETRGARTRSLGPIRTNADGGTADAYCLVEIERAAEPSPAPTAQSR